MSAALVSAAAHGLVLGAIGAGAPASAPEVALDPASRLGMPVEATTLVDLVPAEDDRGDGVATAPAAIPVAAATLVDDTHARATAEARGGPESTAAPRFGAPATARPAPDSGDGVGRRLDDVPWRRDASTLHDRLTNGAERYRPSRLATQRALPASSTESVRREPVVGEGDAVRTISARQPSAVAPAAAPAVDPVSSESGGATADDPASRPAEDSPPPADVPATWSGPAIPSARGPLDADRGARAFDVATGDVMRDRESRRAASAELHPSVTDLTTAAAPGDGDRGRGPGVAPGVVARPSTGASAAPRGADGLSDGLGDAGRARERLNARYELDIRARVNAVLGRVWPRKLALRLEQGETMVHFVVQPDGQLAGPVRVTKSAGFDEFDLAAIEAIRLVTPFPPIPRAAGTVRVSPLPVSLRVTFSNPVIR